MSLLRSELKKSKSEAKRLQGQERSRTGGCEEIETERVEEEKDKTEKVVLMLGGLIITFSSLFFRSLPFNPEINDLAPRGG